LGGRGRVDARIHPQAESRWRRFPDLHTIRQALSQVLRRSPLPWLHIVEGVANEAAACDFRCLAITGTRWLVDSEAYLDALTPQGLACIRPTLEECDEINRIIVDELCEGLPSPTGRKVPPSDQDRGEAWRNAIREHPLVARAWLCRPAHRL
jgi:hypothetical protein